MNGWMDSESSRMYVVERRFGSFEAILRGVLEPYLTEEVKQALMALPRAFSIDTKLAFKDFFDRYGPFFIDQVYTAAQSRRPWCSATPPGATASPCRHTGCRRAPAGGAGGISQHRPNCQACSAWGR